MADQPTSKRSKAAAAAAAAAAVDAKEMPKCYGSATKLAAFGAASLGQLKALGQAPTLVKTVDEYGMTPLCHAARAGDPEVIKYLCVDLKADVNEKGWGGCTPLQFAAAANSDSAVVELLQHGANATLADTAGNTALHYAVKGGQLGCINPLIVEGGVVALSARKDAPVHYNAAAVNARNAAGRTPLHIACNHGQLAAVGLLLKAGADVTAVDAQGNTALHVAAAAGFAKICSTLLAAGAAAAATNANGATAVQLAATAATEKAITSPAPVSAR